MGKIPCSSCNKTCKGQTIKLQDKYFHIKCFKCKECQKLLAAGSFYTKDNFQYCVEDYQRLFCMTCKVCGEFIHGEIVKAYDNAYHDGCFLCSKCRRKFDAGDKVTCSGGEYLCNNCLSGDDVPRKEVLIGRTPEKVSQDDAPILTPFSKLSASAPTTPARQERPIDGCITSGSDMDYLSDVKGSAKNTLTPTRTSTLNTSGYKSDTSYDGEPAVSRNDHLSDVFDDSDTQDPERRQAFLPIQNSMKYRTASPGELSQSSRKSKESLSRFDANYGKFYKTSYLDKKDSFKRGPSINLRDQSPKHYHRPDNFSYSKVQNFLKPSKRGLLSSMAKENRLQESPRGIVYKPDKTEEPIFLSKLPQGMQNGRVAPIERDDWPAPPDPAAAYPELLRDKRFKRKSMPEGMNDLDGDDEIDHVSSTRIIRVEKEIEELSKLPNSGAAKVMLDDLKRAKVREPRPLDPRSSSRTPSAAMEPPYKTRYESSIFASPSRDLDQRLRLRSLDCLTERKFRTQSQISNYPDHCRGYETPRDVVKSRDVVRPGYSLSGRSSAVDSRGRISQMEMYMPRRPDSSAAVLQSNSYYSSQNSIDEYDSTTGLKNVRHRCATPAEEWLSYSGIRRSVPNLFRMEEPPKIFPYEKLKSFKGEYPPAVDANMIEAHLSKEEFESLFQMDHEEFYRLPEWKRNDLKSRVGLF